MSIIPLHLQTRCEQRWAARFGSLVIPVVPKKNVGLKVSPVNWPARGKANEKPAGLRLKAKGNDQR